MPTRLEPTFVVVDHGTGMSKSDILNIYSRYGASTKRNDLTQVGAFGLGCKSALTLTQQFTLVSIKDGERSVVVISRDEDGVGNVSIVDHRDTDEPNGVTVTVPIPEVWRFNDAAKGFFATWKPGSVLIDENQPKSIYDEGYIESDGVYFSMDKYGNGIPSLIIGGIAYTVDGNILPHATRPRVNAYVETPIGAVDLTPSREALRYSERTKRYIAQATAKVAERVIQAANGSLAEASTRAEALKVWEHWTSIIPQANQIEWRGEKYPSAIEEAFNVTYCNVPDSGKRTPWDSAPHIPTGALRSSYYVVGVQDDAERDKVQRSMKLALGEMGLTQQGMFLYFATEPKSPWIVDNANMVRLETSDILAHAKTARSKARKLGTSTGKSATTAVASRATYYLTKFDAECQVSSHENVTIDAIPADVMYVDPKTMNQYVRPHDLGGARSQREMARFAATFMLEGKTIVMLRPGQSATALARRLRIEANDLVDVTTWRKDKIKTIADTITPEVKAYMVLWDASRYSRDVRQILDMLETLTNVSDQFVDEGVVGLIKIAHAAKKIRVVNWCTDDQIKSFEHNGDKTVYASVKKTVNRICASYPLMGIDTSLLRSVGNDKYAQHAVAYVNALYVK